jgi:prepilin-type N-terminal cleavage/methylation domain-containing protein
MKPDKPLKQNCPFPFAGFTLVEMAVVLLIVGLLLGGLLPTLSSRVEQQRMSEVRKQLDEIEQALIGYALINGRLPCPASSSSNGAESFAAGGSAANGVCSNFYNGYAPAATLGLVTADGYAADPWGNRIHYAVTSWNNTYTKTNGMNAAGLANLSPSDTAYLQVCSTATGIGTTKCATGTALTASPGVPLVIYSTGRNGSYGGTGIDETSNPNINSNNNDRVFVSHPPTAASAANGEFDDIVIWLSPSILLGKMVEAGMLP